MARVNITMPDELVQRARSAGLNISRLSAAAVEAELARLTKIAQLGDYLADLELELGPISDEERAAAREWSRQFDRPSAAADAGAA